MMLLSMMVVVVWLVHVRCVVTILVLCLSRRSRCRCVVPSVVVVAVVVVVVVVVIRGFPILLLLLILSSAAVFHRRGPSVPSPLHVMATTAATSSIPMARRWSSSIVISTSEWWPSWPSTCMVMAVAVVVVAMVR